MTAAQMLGDHLARAFSLLGGQPVQFDALGRVRAPFTPEPLPMFKLEIQTDNAAFGDVAEGDREREIARILRTIAATLEAEARNPEAAEGVARDINGNRVGAWSISQ